MSLERKLARLKQIVRRMRSVLLAFSGGVDSTFLLKVLKDTLPEDKLLAVTATSATFPQEELSFAKKITRDLGARHQVIRTNELNDRKFKANTAQRCYFCKKELFLCLRKLAVRHKLQHVADASTLSDDKDYRPGSKAKAELGVRSPLKEARLTKEDIRRLSKVLGLVTWNRPSQACLASRIAYRIRISPAILARIEQGERFLRGLGFREVRLRHHNGLCRIEVSRKEIPRMIKRYDIVCRRLKGLGYKLVTLDLEGYRSGTMNLLLPRKSH